MDVNLDRTREEECINCGKLSRDFIELYIGISNKMKVKICPNCSRDLINNLSSLLERIPEPIPAGRLNLFNLDYFYKAVREGWIDSNDGYGKYANMEKDELYPARVSMIHLSEKEVKERIQKDNLKGYTHVAWFNK